MNGTGSRNTDSCDYIKKESVFHVDQLRDSQYLIHLIHLTITSCTCIVFIQPFSVEADVSIAETFPGTQELNFWPEETGTILVPVQ